MSLKILGLDIATHTGVCQVSDEDIKCKAIKVNQIGFGRLQSIAKEVRKTLEIWLPDFAVVEDYAYCVNIRSFILLVEIGTVIKEVLYDLNIEWIDVPPTVLKKWVVKGSADKAKMAEVVKNRWGFINENSDLVDAFSLAKMGQELGLEKLKELVKRKKNK